MADSGAPLAPLLGALEDLLAWFEGQSVAGIVIGGVAASILGRPRTTADIDALVLLDEESWDGFLAAAKDHGITARVSDAIPFARQSRVLLLRHEASSISLDITFGQLPFERDAVNRAVRLSVAGLEIPLPEPEDLLVMKAVAHRARDLADIEAVLDAQPELDLARVRATVKEFSDALEMPDLLQDLEELIRRRREA